MYINDLATSQDEPVRVVGVVGIGHVLGITKLWLKDQQPFIKDIIFVPPPSLTSKIVKAGVKLSMAALVCYLIYKFVPVPKTLRVSSGQAFEKVVTRIKTYSI